MIFKNKKTALLFTAVLLTTSFFSMKVNAEVSVGNFLVADLSSDKSASSSSISDVKIGETIVAKYKGKVVREKEVLQATTNGRIKKLSDIPDKEQKMLIENYVLLDILSQEAKSENIQNTKMYKEESEKLSKNALITCFIKTKLEAKINQSTVKSKVEELKKASQGKKEFKLAHILKNKKSDIDKIAKKVNAANFHTIAKAESEDTSTKANGGQMTTYLMQDFIPEDISRELTKMLADKKLKKGASANNKSKMMKDKYNIRLSRPIKTTAGWHIFKIDDVKDFKVSESQLKEQAKQVLRAQEMQNLMKFVSDKYNLEVITQKHIPVEKKDKVAHINEESVKYAANEKQELRNKYHEVKGRVKQKSEEVKNKVSNKAEAAKKKAQEVKEETRQKYNELKHNAKNKKDDIKDKVKDKSEDMKNKIDELSKKFNDKAKDINRKAREKYQDFSNSNKPKNATEEVKSKAQNIYQRAKNKTENTYENVKDKVKNSYESGKDKAKNVYQNAKDKTENTYENIKDKAKNSYESGKDKAKNIYENAKAQTENKYENMKDKAKEKYKIEKDKTKNTSDDGVMAKIKNGYEALKSKFTK